ncbi:MAG: universal stress protein [Deltaproteobacteria bacterium]|nr:universal stress protein [Deltaproteobacteria bacterium]
MTAQPTESAPAEPTEPARNVEEVQRGPRTERIKRILVALDLSEHGRAALEAAAELASRLSAELLVLHIEDTDLLHLAALPFAHEIDARAFTRRLETAGMERALKAGARRATQAFERATAGWPVRASFRVVRGGVTREILSAALDVDLLFVGRAGVTRSRRSPLGRTTRSLLGSDSRAVAVLGDCHALGRPIATLFDGSEGSMRALEFAIALAGEDHHNLLVAIPDWPGVRAGSLETLAEAAAQMAAPAAIQPRCVALSPLAMARLPEWLREQGCRGLVVDRSAALFEGRTVAETVEAFDCPVIVVR